MDINEFLGSLQSDFNRSIESIGLSTDTIKQLPHLKGLEEDTENKLRTFERIYNTNFSFDKNIDLDYCPLVNLLATAVETELYMSIYNTMREAYGKDYKFQFQDKEICLRSDTPIMRSYIGCLIHDSERGNRKIPLKDHDKLANLLLDMAPCRNKASHREKISKAGFQKYYSHVMTFFDKWLPQLLELKNSRETTKA